MKVKKPIPYDFVLEALAAGEPYTKPMFGCFGVYVGEKIVFALRNKDEGRQPDDGAWVATTHEHHASLRKEFPSLRSIQLFGVGETGWQVLPASSPSFEEDVLRACELVLAGDERIGKIPERKKKKSKPKPRAATKSSKRGKRR